MWFVQHANEDVEKMILGNKCDMADKRQVPRQKGEEVGHCFLLSLSSVILSLFLIEVDTSVILGGIDYYAD